MSFYNFKLNDPSTFQTSDSPNSKLTSRFVNKTLEDYNSKNNTVPEDSTRAMDPNDPNAGRGKFPVAGWKEKGIFAQGGETGRFRLDKSATQNSSAVQSPVCQIPEEIHAVSIASTLQTITHTYSPLNIATLHSFGHSTAIRLVKLAGQSSWHSHDDTDEVFIVLRGGVNMLYRSASGVQRVTRVVGGELLCVPMKMEHCIVADDGTEVLLLEGRAVLHA